MSAVQAPRPAAGSRPRLGALGALAWRDAATARLPLVAVAAASLLFSIAGLWAAIIGVVINAVLVVLALAAPRVVFGTDRR